MKSANPGVLIGASFGLAFILINAGELPSGIDTILRVLGVVAFLGLVGLLFSRRHATSDSPAHPSPGGMFGRRFWTVVAAEVVVGWVGVIVVNTVLDTPKAGVAWIALVVGLHCVALAVIWKQSSIHWLGASIALCGLADLSLAVLGSSAAKIAVFAGVTPSSLLLGGGWWATLTSHPR
jgi:hypothetical protein